MVSCIVAQHKLGFDEILSRTIWQERSWRVAMQAWVIRESWSEHVIGQSTRLLGGEGERFAVEERKVAVNALKDLGGKFICI